MARGLRGEAAGADGVITLESLGDYVQSHVRDWRVGKETPQVLSSPYSDYPLGVVRASADPLPPIPKRTIEIIR
jgi:hypothetical protein